MGARRGSHKECPPEPWPAPGGEREGGRPRAETA